MSDKKVAKKPRRRWSKVERNILLNIINKKMGGAFKRAIVDQDEKIRCMRES